MKLPKPIAAYFRAQNARSPEAILACFSPRAVVRDEGSVYRGRTGVERWVQHVLRKYDFRITPFASRKDGQEQVVTAELEGTFPGSPVVLDFRFRLAHGLLASLTTEPHVE